MKKIKVLFTTSNFNTAGSGKVIYDLISGLDKSKFDIEIACGSNEGDYFKTMEMLGVPIHIHQTRTTYRPYASLFFRCLKLSRFFKKHHYDLVHSWQWSNDWTEALAAKLAGVKWIYTKKAMGFNSRHWKIKSYLANYIITINAEMQHYFPNKKAQQLIPLGIDTDYYSPQHFTKIDSKRFEIIIVANLVPVKGLEVLIHALKLLNDPSIHLSIVGKNDNEYGISMQKLTEALDLQHQIDFVGKQLDVRPFIANSDLFVIPTLDEGRKEGMPMALVEAMSMGVPLLGSDITGINFVLKVFPELLFKASDSKALAKKIKHMQSLTIQERYDMGQRLRSYCKENFSMENFIEAHEQLYSQLILGSD